MSEQGYEHREEALRQTRRLVRAALFAALTASGALFTVPLPASAVPFTLQVMFTLMSGVLLGAHSGAFSQMVYVALGLLGLPVFSKGGAGLGVLLGPTGGYLIGFVLGAWVAGFLATMARKLARETLWLRAAGYVVAAIVGLATIYIPGTLRLADVLDISIGKAVALGVAPFVLADIAKAVVAAFLVIALERRGLKPA